jgi:hypothetical protein
MQSCWPMWNIVVVVYYCTSTIYSSTAVWSCECDITPLTISVSSYQRRVRLSCRHRIFLPLKRRALLGLVLGLEDNIIIHSVNNILILLSMINSVNVKNNNNNKLQIANRKNTYYVSIS